MDRGFRDNLKENGVMKKKKQVCHMPELLPSTQKPKQFTTKQGNESRRVTLVRWVVEAANGRLKRKFKLLREVVPGGYLAKVESFFKIACAITNRFCPPLYTDTPKNLMYAEKALTLMSSSNAMQARVEDERLDRNTKAWRKLDGQSAPDFPRLSLEDLEGITFGPYQIKLAKRYTKLHVQKKGQFEILLNTEVPGVIRARLESRFSSNKDHQLWVEYDPNITGIDSITGFFCRCKQGARVVGCCAHICCVLWYLAYERHSATSEGSIGVTKKPRKQRKITIRDAKSELKSRVEALRDSDHSDGFSSENE